MHRSPTDKLKRILMYTVGVGIKKMERGALFERNPANHLYLTEYAYTNPSYPKEEPERTLVFVTDIHAGILFSQKQTEQLQRGLALLPADGLVFGGDFGNEPSDSVAFVQSFPLKAYPMGVYTVFGNHDLYDIGYRAPLKEAVNLRGWTLLENKGVRFSDGIYLCGVDDFRQGQADAGKALSGAPKEGLRILVSHNPDLLPDLKEAPFHLALCGHTHGGQVTIRGHSFLSSSKYHDRYRSGWITEEGHDILVSNGIGTSMLPIRRGADPQLIRLRLGHGERGWRFLSHTRMT